MDDADLEEQADAVADFVEELLERMGIDAIAEPTTHRGHVYVDIVDGPEDDMALLIGRHGQTLDAIQELARTVGRPAAGRPDPCAGRRRGLPEAPEERWSSRPERSPSGCREPARRSTSTR